MLKLTHQETSIIRLDMRRTNAITPYWHFKVFSTGAESKLGPHECHVSYSELMEITGKTDARPETSAKFPVYGVGAAWICQHYPKIGARLVMERLNNG